MATAPTRRAAAATAAAMGLSPSGEAGLASTTGPTVGGLTTRTSEASGAPQGTTTGVGCAASRLPRIARPAAPRRGRTGKAPCRTPQGRTSPGSAAVEASGRRVQGTPRVMRTVARPSTTRTAGRLQASASRRATQAGQGSAEGRGRRTTGVFPIKAARGAKGTALASTPAIAAGRTRPVITFSSMLGTPTLRSRSPRLPPRLRASRVVEGRRPSTTAVGTPQERVRGSPATAP